MTPPTGGAMVASNYFKVDKQKLMTRKYCCHIIFIHQHKIFNIYIIIINIVVNPYRY